VNDTKNSANTSGWTPAKTGDRTKAHKGLESRGNDRKTGNLSLQKGELPKSSLYCLLLKEDSVPGSGKPTGVDGGEATIKHKRKLIMITGKEADHLHWQLGCIVACILVLKVCSTGSGPEGKPIRSQAIISLATRIRPGT